MNFETIQSVWPVLLGLGVVLFTCVLFTLASQAHKAISVHDRIRESKSLRQQYLKALEAKQDGR